MVLWHGKSSEEMRGEVLRICEQTYSTITQSRNSMCWRPPIQRRRIEIRGRIVRSMALKLFWNAFSWLVLVGPIFYGMWTNLLVRSTNVWHVLISYIHHTSESRQHCHVGNTAHRCKFGLLQDSDLARDLDDSKSTSGGILCTFGSHTFVPISWMCKKQTSVSLSSTEAELISLDAGSRMDGIPALDLWDLVIEVFHSSPNQTNKAKDVREPLWNLSATPQSNMRKQIPTTNTNLDLINIDHVPSNGTHSG